MIKYFIRTGYFLSLLLLLAQCKKEDINLETGKTFNVITHQHYAYLANGTQGIQVIDLESNETKSILLPILPTKSIDDLSIDRNYLFALDADESGFISVYDISNPSSPKILSSTTPVPVGPYAGISAKNGNVVVSGGTKYFSHRTYNSNGGIKSQENDLTRDQGHPDVLLTTDGNTALISTHFEGERFGIISASLSANNVNVESEITLNGAGFSTGTIDLIGFPIKSDLYKNHVLVAHGGGLSILSLNDSKLTLLQTLNLGIEAINVSVYKDIAYVIGYKNGPQLLKISLSDINNPIINERIVLSNTSVSGLDVSENGILITTGAEGIIRLNK